MTREHAKARMKLVGLLLLQFNAFSVSPGQKNSAVAAERSSETPTAKDFVGTRHPKGEPLPASKIACWNTPLRGANYIAYRTGVAKDMKAASDYGIRVLRLFLPGVPTEWGNEDYFRSAMFKRDLIDFDRLIDQAKAAGLNVIVAGGSVPGRQWLWMQHRRGDRRLWRSFRWHEEFAKFWVQIAQRYRNQPEVIGYELLNEPRFENSEERKHWTHAALSKFARKVKGTPGDLNLLYERTVRAIRRVDSDTPIIINSGLWASPKAFFYLRPISDNRVIYSFHWYAPLEFTIWRLNQGSVAYPGNVTVRPSADGSQERVVWNIETHRREMARPIRRWQEEHGVSSDRILLGEFSADRRALGADRWNRDVINIAEENGWHWTYYAFREREWDAKDFELGSRPANKVRSHTDLMKTFTRFMTAATKREREKP